MLGTALLSSYSDARGRRPAFLISMSILICAMLVQVLAPLLLGPTWLSYGILLFGRILMGMGVGGNGVIAYVWGVEWVLYSSFPSPSPSPSSSPSSSDNKGVVAAAMFQLSWSLGGMLLSPLAMLIPSFQAANLFFLLLDIALLFWIYTWVRESPRWLQLNVSELDARQQVDRVGRFNSQSGWAKYADEMSQHWSSSYRSFSTRWSTLTFGSLTRRSSGGRARTDTGGDEVDDDDDLFEEDQRPILTGLVSHATLDHDHTSSDPATSSPLDLFRTPYTRSTLLLALIWFANAFVYYGLSLNASHLPGLTNVYLVSFLLNLLSIPGQLITVPCVYRFGLRNSMCGSLFLTGTVFIACLLFMLFSPTPPPSTPPTAPSTSWSYDMMLTCFNLLAELFITAAFTLCYMITSHSYPTRLRNRGVGVGVVMGRIGAMTCPFLVVAGTADGGGTGGEGEGGALGVVGVGVLAGVCILSALAVLGLSSDSHVTGHGDGEEGHVIIGGGGGEEEEEDDEDEDRRDGEMMDAQGLGEASVESGSGGRRE